MEGGIRNEAEGESWCPEVEGEDEDEVGGRVTKKRLTVLRSGLRCYV